MTAHVHLADCTGNGSEPCWDCGGDGFVCVAEDDDPMGDIEYRCDTCGGKGVVVCPGCEAMLAIHFVVNGEDTPVRVSDTSTVSEAAQEATCRHAYCKGEREGSRRGFIQGIEAAIRALEDERSKHYVGTSNYAMVSECMQLVAMLLPEKCS